jgi:parallel beta-helix repeat protein
MALTFVRRRTGRSRTRLLRVRPRLLILEGRDLPSTLYVDPSGQYRGQTAYTRIQDAVIAANAGDEIAVAPGTYTEQVTIAADDDNLTLRSIRPLAAVIKAPPAMTAPNAIVHVQGADNVTITGFTITGKSDSLEHGVLIDAGGSAIVQNNHITNIQNIASFGVQRGIGVTVGGDGAGSGSQSVIARNVIDAYQKGGVVVDGAGYGAVVDRNTITGIGPNDVIAQNGVQVSDGATAVVTRNDISKNVYTNTAVPDTATGVLLFEAGAAIVDRNDIRSSDVGIYVLGGTGAQVVHNDIRGSTFDGIDLDGTTNALVAHNKVRDSGNDGIALFNNSTNNRVEDNDSSKNGNDGIFVEAGSTGNVFRRNKMKHNGNFDAEDQNTGLPTGTDGTGNTWEDNKCKTDNHNGRLCR